MRSERSDWALLGVLWAVFTAVGLFLALGVDLLPAKWSREAHIVDEAYVLLIAIAVPIFALVASVLLVAMMRFKTDHGDGPPTEDGPASFKNERRLVRGWLIVTSLLALGVTINPGFVGLADLRGESSADLVVGVQAQRWSWAITYENGAVVRDELVLPADERVRFDVTSIDIVHSFWVPAFRTKIDAVPGRLTKLYVTPEGVGGYDDDVGLRVQCAEICGLGHSAMSIPVRVMESEDFQDWLDSVEEAEEGA